MYGKRKFTPKRIGAKLNWFNFRRKLENAKSTKLLTKSRYKYYKRVVPALRKKFRQVKNDYGSRTKVKVGLRSKWKGKWGSPKRVYRRRTY